MSRITIRELAKQAGVSTATVDRVLNGRLPVRAETAKRVLAAAQASEYHATDLIRRRVDNGAVQRRLGFLLLRRSTEFYRELGEALAQAASAAGAKAKIEYLQDLTPRAVATRLTSLGQGSDVVAIVAADHPSIVQAVEGLRDGGIPTVALISDLSARAAYVGLNPRKAGRSAACFMARFCRRPGKVGILVGSHRYAFQELCEISFRAYFREHDPEFHLLEPMANMEDSALAHEATLDLIRRHPDLAGLYVAGGGSEGVISALREEPASRSIVMICQDLMGQTRAGLMDGIVDLVISHPVDDLARHTVDAMLRSVQHSDPGHREVVVPFDVTIAENM